MADWEENEEDRGTDAEGTRRLFEALFGEEAEAVAAAILLEDDSPGQGAIEGDDDEAVVDRLMVVVQQALEDTARGEPAKAGAPAPASAGLRSVKGGARLRSGRKRNQRRHAPYVRGSVNVLQFPKPTRIRESCALVTPRLHMSGNEASRDYALDLKPYREWFDSHGAGWIGDNLLFLDAARRPLVRVTTAAGDLPQGPAPRLIVKLVTDNGKRREVRLSSRVREKELDWEPEDGSVADWMFSIAVERSE